MLFGVRIRPWVVGAARDPPLALGMHSDFHPKIDQNCILPPARRYTQEALSNTKHPPNVNRAIANHKSLSRATPSRVRSRPGVVWAARSPPFGAQREQRFSLEIWPKHHIPAHQPVHSNVRVSVSKSIQFLWKSWYSGTLEFPIPKKKTFSEKSD
jgi:hypothetical protein